MNSGEQAREHLAHERSQEDQRQSSMATRTQEEMKHLSSTVEEESREALSEHRQHRDHLEETMMARTESEIT